MKHLSALGQRRVTGRPAALSGALLVLVCLSSVGVVLGGSCAGLSAANYGDVLSDGPGNYAARESCRWTLPGPPGGSDRYLALVFTELHVEGDYDSPCLPPDDAVPNMFSCMAFPEAMSFRARAHLDALTGTSNYTLCSPTGLGQFAWESDSRVAYAGFSATVSNVSVSECQNALEGDGMTWMQQDGSAFLGGGGGRVTRLGQGDDEPADDGNEDDAGDSERRQSTATTVVWFWVGTFALFAAMYAGLLAVIFKFQAPPLDPATAAAALAAGAPTADQVYTTSPALASPAAGTTPLVTAESLPVASTPPVGTDDKKLD